MSRRNAWPIQYFILAATTVVVSLGVVLFRSRYSQLPSADRGLPVDRSNTGQVETRVENPGYVGMHACTPCHAERVAEFVKTRHYRANCVPDQSVTQDNGFASSDFAGFTPEGSLDRPDLSLRFKMTESNGHLLQTVLRGSNASQVASTSEVAFVYGAQGGNDEVYFGWKGDRLYELPMVWLAPEKVWGTSSFDRHGDGDFSRDTTVRCLECHNTWFNHVPGSRNEYKHEGNLIGVTCEVCHAPGRDHVAYHRQNPGLKEPHAIVRPAMLSRERKMDLCAQCHSNAIKHKQAAFSYRPGQPLSDSYFSLRTKYPEDDHVANQTTYLQQSKCFQKSDMTCITCHNPHQSRSETNAGTVACLKCHAAHDCTDRGRIPEAVQNDCVSCHMPERRKIQVFFQTQQDKYVPPVKRYEHRIGIYPADRRVVLRAWFLTQSDPESHRQVEQLSKELAEWYRSECDALQQSHRYLAAINACREMLKFSPGAEGEKRLKGLIEVQSQIDNDFQDGQWHDRNGRYPQAIESFLKVLATKPDFAAAHARLGTAYATVGEKQLADKELLAATTFDPDDPYAFAMLGWLAYLSGNYEESLTHYQKAGEVEPYSAQITFQTGMVLAKLKRWDEAAERLSKATVIDPQNPEAFVRLSEALRHAEEPRRSLVAAQQAANLSLHKDPRILLNLSEAYVQLSQTADAVRSAEAALAATKQDPQLATQIQIRLDELKARTVKPR